MRARLPLPLIETWARYHRNMVEGIMVSEFQRAGFSAFDSPNTLEV